MLFWNFNIAALPEVSSRNVQQWFDNCMDWLMVFWTTNLKKAWQIFFIIVIFWDTLANFSEEHFTYSQFDILIFQTTAFALFNVALTDVLVFYQLCATHTEGSPFSQVLSFLAPAQLWTRLRIPRRHRPPAQVSCFRPLDMWKLSSLASTGPLHTLCSTSESSCCDAACLSPLAHNLQHLRSQRQPRYGNLWEERAWICGFLWTLWLGQSLVLA